MRKIKVNGRYLSWSDGSPFFYLADTAWELFHRLNREEMDLYFEQRSRQGFNAVQAVVLAEYEGVTTPNAYGRLPLYMTDGIPDPEKPDSDGGYSYWDHVDFAVDTAARYGIFITMLPTWGDKFNLCWGKGPVIFNEANAYVYGKWIGSRYADRENIIWMLGGDRPLESAHRRVIDAMAKGILKSDPNHLVTFHPNGGRNSTEFLNDADYLDFHTAQTGHGVEQCYMSDKVMLRMAEASQKPFMDSESRYEDHPACFDEKLGYYWNADDVRQNAYWNMMAGVCGITYGNHCVWSMTKEAGSYFPFVWKDAMLHTGAQQIHHLWELRMSHDFYSFRHAPELICADYDGMAHLAAGRGTGYGYVYSPLGLPFTVNLDLFADAGKVRAAWFNPRDGKTETIAVFPAMGRNTFVPPSFGKGNDWVLVLEA